MYIEYECGCTSDKMADKDKKRCDKHPWVTVIKMICEEMGISFNTTTL